MSSDLLNIAATGMDSSKKALATISHNMANANTEGYTRQNTHLTTARPIGRGHLFLGSGVDVSHIKRVHDEFIEKKLNQSLSEYNYHKERSHLMGIIEENLNEINAEGFSQVLNKFFNSFQELSHSPESETVRSMVRDQAKILIKEIRNLRSRFSDLSKGLDKAYELAVADINQQLENLAGVNKRILSMENIHGETGDLRDERDQLLKNLSSYFTLSTYTDEKGRFIVSAENIGTIINSTYPVKFSSGITNPENPNSAFPATQEIYIESQGSSPISSRFKMGKLAAIYQTRYNEIWDLQKNMDEMAWGLSQAVNAIHRKGHTYFSKENDAPGNTGINFFKPLDSSVKAAEYISLSDEVEKDSRNIVAALSPASPGDNRTAIAIAKLKSIPISHNGQKTLESHYMDVIGSIGITSHKLSISMEQAHGLLAQMETLRERVSGVSLDEEAANMVKFQHLYDASAKVMKVGEEMFKTLLSIKS